MENEEVSETGLQLSSSLCIHSYMGPLNLDVATLNISLTSSFLMN